MKTFTILAVFATLAVVYDSAIAATPNSKKEKELFDIQLRDMIECPDDNRPVECPLECSFRVMGALKDGKFDYQRLEYIFEPNEQKSKQIRSCVEKANTYNTNCEAQRHFSECIDEKNGSNQSSA